MAHLPQHGILRPQSAHHYFLEYAVPDDANLVMAADVIYPLWSECQPNPVRGISTRGGGGASMVIAFGAKLWRRLREASGRDKPQFAEATQEKTLKIVPSPNRIPARQPDLWLWLHDDTPDGNFGRAMNLNSGLTDLGLELLAGEPGFRAQDGRDLTGFVDGIGNPDENRQANLAFTENQGSSYVMIQRWVHDLRAFHRLDISAQERVVGRRKADGADLCHEYGYGDSHVSRMRKAAGYGPKDGKAYEERQIVRRSVPVGTIQNPGLYFIGFFHQPDLFGELLSELFDTPNDGKNPDRMLAYSRPERTALLYAPSVTELTDVYEHLPQ